MILRNLLLIGNSKALAKILKGYLVSDGNLHLVQHLDTPMNFEPDVVFIQHEWSRFRGLKHISPTKSQWPEAPVIVVGDILVSQGEVAQAFRLGAADFLFTPLEEESLLSCLSRFKNKKYPGSRIRRIASKLVEFIGNQLFLPVPKFSNGVTPISVKAAPKSMHNLSLPPSLQIELLGKLRMIYKGEPVNHLPSRKARSMLAFILIQYPQPVHREVLIDKFWPNSTLSSARNCLNVTIHSIRKCFDEISIEEQVLVYHEERYKINPELSIERDIDLFENYWNLARQIETQEGMKAAVNTYHQAFAFYRGDLLEEFPYEDWVCEQRERWKEKWLVILDRLSKHFFAMGKYEIALNLCKKMLLKDPCLEDSHRRLMACYSKLDMKDLALKQYRRCSEVLKDELCVHPGKATIDLYEEIQAA